MPSRLPDPERPPTAPPRFPALLDLSGRRVLVVGGGEVAVRRVRELRRSGARVQVVAPEVVPDLDALATAGDVDVARRRYHDDDLTGVWLVLAATDDPVVNARVVAEAEARRLWANRVDQADGSPVTVPARLARGDVLVTVSTGGRSPALARWLRDGFRDQLDDAVLDLLDLLDEARAESLRAGRRPTPVDWRRALDSGMLDLVREGRLGEAKELLRSCLSSSSA